MPRYAHFDHTAPAPAPVLGWYDADALSYPILPPEADLLEVADADWEARMPGPFAVQDGKLVPYTPPVPVVPLATQADQAFSAATMTCFQRFAMMGVAIPQPWIDYNKALAAIIDGSSAATALPTAPS
ncbi:hypothetical protein [Rhizosaccharibacter radicis]|uniref:Uncharacterized protein n=1 Tax=Rhizosaccharibacter radicis TaxID=2782605 RepID=A0ABT1VXT8_9PROT|nr:hypothetical protein [Acetobacteraceae bacterium KSS12]